MKREAGIGIEPVWNRRGFDSGAVKASSLREAIAADSPCLACGLYYEIRPIESERASAYRNSAETPSGSR
jgi:hypothetical protein